MRDFSKEYILDQIVADYKHKQFMEKMRLQTKHVEEMFSRGLITDEQHKEYYLSEDPDFIPKPKL